MIEIPGDMLEGGGQIIRTSISLAALTGEAVHITKIRHKRPNPGLQPQHVTATKALASFCDAQTEGLTQRSTELYFRPRERKSGRFRFDVGTAGSISLVLQALMPALAFAPDYVELEITGGTDVKWSPPIDYVRFIILPTLRLMGYETNLTVHSRGHYPKGGGRVTFSTTPPKRLQPITLTKRDQLISIEGMSHCVRLPSHVAQRQSDAATQMLAAAGYGAARVRVETYPRDQDPHIGSGSGITLSAKHANGSIIGADSLGERGRPAEEVGEEAARMLIEELHSQASFDRHMGDILIPYMAVAEGLSEISVSQITMHTLTNIQIAEKILNVKFHVSGSVGHQGMISVNGRNLRT